MKPTLWTRNFTIITLGTLISAIGGVAMQLALTLVVFDETESTLLSGLFAAASMLPGMTLPVLMAPLIDRCNRKRMIVSLDYINAVLYILIFLYCRAFGFRYGAYVLFSFIAGSIGSVYSITYSSWYPDLIPAGFEQKGYSVSSFIYPITTTLVTPLAAIAYSRWGVEYIILTEGILLAVAATFESFITWQHTPAERKQESLRERAGAYFHDMTESFRYLKQEKGIRNIYTYMTITNASGNGMHLMTMTHFQTSDILTTTMFSLLTSAETIGRAVGAVVHYLFKIPRNRRYWLTVRVYMLYEICDGALLFLAYPVMLVLKFLCGFLGINTATLREAATQSYLPQDMRARINGLFQVLISIGMVLVQLLVGALGEIFPYRYVSLGFATVAFTCILIFIVRNKEDVRKIYEYERPTENETAEA